MFRPLDDEQLKNVLTNGSTGRNPTFFKAFGHEDVFGLKADLPPGSQTMEMEEKVPCEDSQEGTTEESVLYVQLPEGHPVITQASSAASSPKDPAEAVEKETAEKESKPDDAEPGPVQHSLSFEEAIEQAEVIFGEEMFGNTAKDKDTEKDKSESSSENKPTPNSENSVCKPIKVDVGNESTTRFEFARSDLRGSRQESRQESHREFNNRGKPLKLKNLQPRLPWMLM